MRGVAGNGRFPVMDRRLKAILINLPIPFVEDDERQPPGGLVSIATYARTKGFDISVCDLAGVNENGLLARIGEADVYGIGTYTANYALGRVTAMQLKERSPGAVVVAGGPHASALPNEVAKDFDVVVCGEGEEVFCDILRAVQNGKRPAPIINADPVENLDALPFPDYYQFCDLKKYTRRIHGLPVMCIDSSRGCNFRCRFCNSVVSKRGQWRKRSAGNVYREMRWHYDMGWRAFRFNDDNFLVDVGRVCEICELVKSLQIKWRIFARAESLDAALCQRLRTAGCIHVSVGVESLAPELLKRMGKATCVAKIKQGLQNARDAGIMTRGFFIVGFPGETDETVKETIDALEDLALDEATVYPCIAYPGTDLFRSPERYNITWIDREFSNYIQIGRGSRTGYVIQTEQYGPEKIEKWRQALMNALEASRIGWCDAKQVVV